MKGFSYDMVPDDIEVHWQHPRTGVEHPVLLVWPMPVRDRWAAVVDDGVAWVVSHTTLYEDADGEIEKIARYVNPNEPIPWCVAEALRRYDGNYGPVETVANPDTGEDGPAKQAPLPDDQATLGGAP